MKTPSNFLPCSSPKKLSFTRMTTYDAPMLSREVSYDGGISAGGSPQLHTAFFGGPIREQFSPLKGKPEVQYFDMDHISQRSTTLEQQLLGCGEEFNFTRQKSTSGGVYGCFFPSPSAGEQEYLPCRLGTTMNTINETDIVTNEKGKQTT